MEDLYNWSEDDLQGGIVVDETQLKHERTSRNINKFYVSLDDALGHGPEQDIELEGMVRNITQREDSIDLQFCVDSKLGLTYILEKIEKVAHQNFKDALLIRINHVKTNCAYRFDIKVYKEATLEVNLIKSTVLFDQLMDHLREHVDSQNLEIKAGYHTERTLGN